MCNDDIEIKTNESSITIVNQEEKIDLINSDNGDITIQNQECNIVLEEEVAEQIIINATDLRITGSGAADISFNCTADEQINDLVYVLSAGEVRRADASDISTARAIGFVASKTSDTQCKVRNIGLIDSFVGLSAGANYFLDTAPGAVTTSPPTNQGEIIVRVAEAIDSTTLLININNSYVVRS